jgi:hypothetical protein
MLQPFHPLQKSYVYIQTTNYQLIPAVGWRVWRGAGGTVEQLRLGTADCSTTAHRLKKIEHFLQRVVSALGERSQDE